MFEKSRHPFGYWVHSHFPIVAGFKQAVFNSQNAKNLFIEGIF